MDELLCSCLTLLICVECIIDYFMYVCVSIGRFALCDLSSVCDLFACRCCDLPTCNLFMNVLINRPNIIILTLFVNQSTCAEYEKLPFNVMFYGQ